MIASRTLASGTPHTLEIRPDGTLWAWGTAAAGLGLGELSVSEWTPTEVVAAGKCVSVAAQPVGGTP